MNPRYRLPAALISALLAGCEGPAATATGPDPTAPVSAAVSAAVSARVTPSRSAEPSSPASMSAPASTATPLPTMPPGFPVHSSMVEATPRPGFIAAWTSDADPSDIYDFYLAELVAAGFVIDLEAPGGEVAILRFHAPDGTPFQLDLLAYSWRPVEVIVGPPHP